MTVEEFQIIHDQRIYSLDTLPSQLKESLLQKLQNDTTNEEKPPVSSIIEVQDLYDLAPNHISSETYAYYSTGANQENSLAENEKAYKRIWFNPRVLRSVTDINLRTKVFGREVQLPVYITAFYGAAMDDNKEGEKPLIQGAKERGVLSMIPGLTQFDVKELALTDEDLVDGFPLPPQWYQIYIRGTFEDANKTLRQLEQASNITTAVFTIDTAQIGSRLSHQRKNGYIRQVDKVQSNLNWNDLIGLKNSTHLQVVLKGVQTAEDAIKAAELGFHGIILSNHGGRQLDFAKSSIEVLTEVVPELKKRGLYEKLEIYLDGGVKNGNDVIKALALGAKAVGLGRTFAYALQLYGKEGVIRVLDILKNELECSLRLLGVSDVKDLNETHVDITNLSIRG